MFPVRVICALEIETPKYYGTAVIFKTHTPEYKAKRKVNEGEVERYAAEGNNEPIITEEIFNKVQEERSHRSNIEIGEDGVKKRKSTSIQRKDLNRPTNTINQCV